MPRPLRTTGYALDTPGWGGGWGYNLKTDHSSSQQKGPGDPPPELCRGGRLFTGRGGK